jgi:putative ABC transport system permease protein
MLRVLGLSQRRIAGAYALEFGLLGLLASGRRAARAGRCTTCSSGCWRAWWSAALPPPGPWPALFGLGVGMTLLLGFGLPPVLQLARVPPLRVIRRDVGGLKAASATVLLAGVGGFAALLMAVSSDMPGWVPSRSAALRSPWAYLRCWPGCRCACSRRRCPTAGAGAG